MTAGGDPIRVNGDFAPPPELLRPLLRGAGVRGEPEGITLLGVSTSRVWALTVGERRYVVRHRLDGDARMATKEAYLGDLLRRRGVPAPETLATVVGEHGVATLSTFLPGIRLDQAIRSLPAPALRDAWRSVGAVLRRVHEIALPEAGEIVGDRVEPFAGGWARYVTEGLTDDLRRLRSTLGEPELSPPLLNRVVAGAAAALRDAPIRLLHNDALPQNVLVERGPDGWRCSGRLDWEFARAGDPGWDLAALDFRPAGLVPPAFYEGYGAPPTEAHASVYELLQATWRARVELEHGPRWDWPPFETRVAYLRDLPRRLDRLSELLEVKE